MSNDKTCSFCGTLVNQSSDLVEGIDESYICANCAEAALEDLGGVKEIGEVLDTSVLKKPKEIKAFLDDYIIGQEEAKRTLSVAAYNHYKRIHLKSKVDIQKSNVLLIGPSGSGKTLLIQTLSKLLDVPMVIGDATTLTEAGYIGDDVQSLVQKLYVRAGKDKAKTERGIIYIDEIDKIANSADDNNRKDVGGRSVQEALLKLIEDTEVNVDAPPIGVPMIGNNEGITISTKNILFIFSGAFVGLEKNSKGKEVKEKVMGFAVSASPEKPVEKITEYTHEMFIKFGFIPELMGRIPIIASLDSLKKEDLINILTKPKNSVLKQYQELFKMDGVKLKFDKDAVAYIADEAISRKIGARGLKTIIEKRMMELMYEVPSYETKEDLVITKEMLLTKKSA